MGQQTPPGSPPATAPTETPDVTAVPSTALDARPDSSPDMRDDAEDYSNGLTAAISAALNPDADPDTPSTPDPVNTAEDEESPPADGTAEDEGEAEEKDAAEEDKSDTPTAEGDDTDADAEDDPSLPFHKHERWQKMIRDRNTYRDQAAELEPRAKQYDQIREYMTQHQITDQEVVQAFRVMALMKTDPAAAHAELRQTMEMLDEFVGERLPADLQREVDDGLVSMERAQELARLRQQFKHQEQQVQLHQQRQAELTQHQQQQVQHQQQAQLVAQQRSAVAAWEAKMLNRDPDYKRLQSMVVREMVLSVQRTPPRSVEEAVKLAESAYKAVKAEVRSLLPAKPKVAPSPDSSRTPNAADTRPAPGSYLEAIQQVVIGE